MLKLSKCHIEFWNKMSSIAFLLIFLTERSIVQSLEFVTSSSSSNSSEIRVLPIVRMLPYNDYRVLYNLRYQPVDFNLRVNEIVPIREEDVSPTIGAGFNQTVNAPSPTVANTGEVATESPAATTTTMSDLMPVRPTVVENTSTTSSTSIMKPTRTPPNLGEHLKNLLLFGGGGSPSEANLIEKLPAASQPKGKGFLSLFEVIKFENSMCSVTTSDIRRTLEGTCYHEFECKSLRGIPMGRCAQGVGVCCVFTHSCGDVTNQPIAYYESPSYPKAVRELLICVLTVELRRNVRQIRLDFLMFEINRPTDGDCIDDQFIVSGQNLNFVVPIICGINTGQHMYIDVNNAVENKIFLSIFGKGTGGRSFNMRVAQLENDLAPEGCLQYYTAAHGFVKSFNYDEVGSIVESRVGTYLNNLNYAICMKRAKQTCTVLYSIEPVGEHYDFQILNKDEDRNDIVADGQAGAGIFNCPDDYIAINQVRLCGERFNDGSELEDYTQNARVRDNSAGPIVLPFRTDSAHVGRGFQMEYLQEDCL